MYSGKLHAMLAAIEEHLEPIPGVQYHQPSGGLYVWVTLPEGMEAGPESELWTRCVESGVLYVPGEFCYPTEGVPIQANSMRLSFGVQSEGQIREGIRILATAIESLR